MLSSNKYYFCKHSLVKGRGQEAKKGRIKIVYNFDYNKITIDYLLNLKLCLSNILFLKVKVGATLATTHPLDKKTYF